MKAVKVSASNVLPYKVINSIILYILFILVKFAGHAYSLLFTVSLAVKYFLLHNFIYVSRSTRQMNGYSLVRNQETCA